MSRAGKGQQRGGGEWIEAGEDFSSMRDAKGGEDDFNDDDDDDEAGNVFSYSKKRQAGECRVTEKRGERDRER